MVTVTGALRFYTFYKENTQHMSSVDKYFGLPNNCDKASQGSKCDLAGRRQASDQHRWDR